MIRVLIVDDHPIARGGLKGILADELDIEVCEAGHVDEASRLISEQDWHLVVLDLDLPGKSGLELLKTIKRDQPLLPVLVLSVYPEEQFAVRTLRAGASGFISKDAAPQELVKGVKKILGGGRYISDNAAEQLLLDSLDEKNARSPHESLSDREFQILCLLGSGKSVVRIAEELSLSVPTVSTYRARILEKMRMRTTAELVRYALQNDLVK
jgi:DNA-binding NarL/FixJ family response regulator